MTAPVERTARGVTVQSSEFRRRPTLALFAVGLAVATWGWSNVAIKAVGVSGLVASFYRLWLALPPLWLAVFVVPGLRARLDRNWARASLRGGLLFGFHQILFFTSLKLTSVANVSIIGALQPALVLVVAGPMFGESASFRSILWSVLALLGTAVVVVASHGTPGWSPLGDVLAFANLFVFTAYFLASKRIRATVGTSEYVIGLTTVAALVVFVAAISTGQDLASPRGSDWGILVGLALVSGTLGHLLTNWAHPHASAFIVSIMFLGVPVLASAGAAVYLGETLGAWQIVGGATVLIAIAVIVLSSGAEAAEELAESAAETDAP